VGVNSMQSELAKTGLVLVVDDVHNMKYGKKPLNNGHNIPV